MAKNNKIDNIGEVLVANSDRRQSAERTALLKEGRLRKIAPRVYTSNMEEDSAAIVRRNLFR